MENTPRKASDILLELVSKVDVLVSSQRAHDLDIKILSNKLNEVMRLLEKQSAAPQKITVEAVNTMPPTPSPFHQLPVTDPERQVPISAESGLPLDNSPKGFRRTSRPETFEGDNAYLAKQPPQPSKPQQPQPKFPVQMPKPPPGRAPGDMATQPTPTMDVKPPQQQQQAPQQPKSKQTAPPQHAIPVMQRIVDKSGKSVFLADVEIVDHQTATTVFKTRTNGTGKWMASLGAGSYQVTVRKGASMSKEKVEAVQEIQVSGNESPLELQTMIIR